MNGGVRRGADASASARRPDRARRAVRAAPREALTPELVSTLNDRLGLLVRLGAARDAGVLTDEEFLQEKQRLLAL